MTSRPATLLAGWAIALLAAGDAVRYSIGYVGWGIVCGATLVVAIVVLWRERVRLRGVPVTLLVLLGLMLLSTAWAVSAPATLLGTALQVATAIAGLLLALLDPQRLSTILHAVLQGILALSIAFELAVATLVGGRVYPIVPLPGADYEGDDVPAAFAWSRGELLEGERIQGIVGNANLLAMLALLALVVAVCLAAARRLRWPAVWIALPLVVLVLTRSATVLVAALAIGVAAALLLAARSLPRTGFLVVAGSLGVAALAVAAALVATWQQLLAAIGRSPDLTGRFDIWDGVLAIWREHPLAGIGWVGYWPPWVAPYDGLFSQGGVQYLQAHSVPLDLLMQLGVVGVVAWVALQASAVRSSVRWLRDPGAGHVAERAIPLLLLVALAVQGFAESRPLIELGFALLVAVAAGLSRRDRLVRA